MCDRDMMFPIPSWFEREVNKRIERSQGAEYTGVVVMVIVSPSLTDLSKIWDRPPVKVDEWDGGSR